MSDDDEKTVDESEFQTPREKAELRKIALARDPALTNKNDPRHPYVSAEFGRIVRFLMNTGNSKNFSKAFK